MQRLTGILTGTAHHSDHSVVRQMPTGTTSHWSNSLLFRQHKTHCCDIRMIRQDTQQSLLPLAVSVHFIHVGYSLFRFVIYVPVSFA